MISLVGYTGFVGSNIYLNSNNLINRLYNSKNITDAYNTKPDLLIYAGLRAEKYLANNFPEKDLDLIFQAEKNIQKINPKKIVLISTIDIFKNPVDVNEDSEIDTENLHAYGLNRYKLERWVRENFHDALIIRLPGLFGVNIKKNFIYDFINLIPFMLKEEKFNELLKIDYDLNKYYKHQNNGFYKVVVSDDNKKVLKDKFKKLNFSALNFTDSRSVYQFYNLSHLWNDINTCLNNDIQIWHPATEPISAGELYKYLTGEYFINELNGNPAFYNYKTKYASLFGSSGSYIANKQQVMKDIKDFVFCT